MAILTDFFIAPPGPLPADRLRDGPGNSFPTTMGAWKNVDLQPIADLDEFVTDLDCHRTFEILDKSLIVEYSDEGPWIYRLRHEFVRGLASLEKTRAEEIAVKWAETEGWLDPDPKPDKTKSFIEMLFEFCALAKQAVNEQKHMYVWICL